MTRASERLAASAIALSAVDVLASLPSSTHASIIEMTGVAELAAAPESVARRAWESDTRTNVFVEQQTMLLSEDLNVDIIASGLYDGPDDFTPGPIAAGTVIDSYFVHQDALGRRGNIFLHSTITFDQDVIGVIVSSELLDASDAILGLSGTLYPTGADAKRRLDFPQSMDKILISEDRRTITLDLQTQVAMDHIRILTAAAVPGPGSIALLMAAGLTASSRRKRHG